MTITLEREVAVVSRTLFNNPFYVVVHSEGVVPLAPIMDVTRANQVLNEVDFIRNFEEYAELDQKTHPETILSGIPRDRPVLVCGFFGNICVLQQRDALRRAGYDAHIYQEAAYY